MRLNVVADNLSVGEKVKLANLRKRLKKMGRSPDSPAMDISELFLPEFKATGIDADLANPKERWPELIADLRYLGNSAYPRLKAGKPWGEWTLPDVLKYFAAIVDSLRGVFFPIIPKKDSTSYWRCYWEAERFMKSKPPAPEKVKEWDAKRATTIKSKGEALERVEFTEALSVESENALKQSKGKGLYLVPPHGQLIWTGKKRAVLSAKKFMDVAPRILVSGRFAYGLIWLKGPREISLSEFEKLKHLHQVSDEERGLWWPGKAKLYLSEIYRFVRFAKPKECKVARGVQKYVNKVDLLENWAWPKLEDMDAEYFTKLKPLELVTLRADLHQAWGCADGDEQLKGDLLAVDIRLKNEMFAREMEVRTADELDRIALLKMDKLKDSSEGEEFVLLKDVHEAIPERFVLSDPLASLTGATSISGRGHDPDLHYGGNLLSKRGLEALMFRLNTYLKNRLGRTFHFIPEAGVPFTSNLPFLRLVVEKIPFDEGRYLVLSYQEAEELLEADLKQLQARAAKPETKAQAERAAKADKLTLGEFFYNMKPVRVTLAGQRQNIDNLCKYLKPETYETGWFCEKKYDGAMHFIHKDGNTLKIFSEDGIDNVKSLPGICEAVRKLKARSLITLAEIEAWDGKKHMPREFVAGQIHRKGPADDSNLLANIFDVVYLEGKDLHKMPFSERRKVLEGLGIKQSTFEEPDLKHRLNLVPTRLVKSEAELRKAWKFLSERPASEGFVIKRADSPYYLDGNARNQWFKLHANFLAEVMVVEGIETATKGVYNYRWCIDPGRYHIKPGDLVEVRDKEYVEGGKSFATTEVMRRGDIFTIEGETFNFIEDQRDNTVRVSIWAPRFFSRLAERTEPDSIDEVLAKARKARCLQRKMITKEGEMIYEEVKNLWDDLKQFTGNQLTAEEKEFRMKNYEHLKKIKSPPELDEEIIPYLDRINAFPFLVTTQSCCGHGRPQSEKHAHADFRSGLNERDTIDFLLRPLADRSDPNLSFELMTECDRLRYIIWLSNDKWKEQLEYFIHLLQECKEKLPIHEALEEGETLDKTDIKWVIPRIYIPRMQPYTHEWSKDDFSKKIIKWRAEVDSKDHLEYFGELIFKAIKTKLGAAWDVITYPGQVDAGRPIHHLVKWLAKKMKIPYRSIQTQEGSSFRNKRVLIVDDIVASGATVRKAAQRVLRHNPEKVGFAALARSKPRLKEKFWLIREDFSEIDTLTEEEYIGLAREKWGIPEAEVRQAWKVPRKVYPTDQELLEALGDTDFDRALKKVIAWAEKQPQYRAMLENHFRGEGSHKDFRTKMNSYLKGKTIADMVEGEIKKDVETIREGLFYTKNAKWKFHPEMSPAIHCYAFKKGTQPLVWLGLNHLHMGNFAVMPPGSPGATRFEPGVFVGLSEGMAWPTCFKPYYEEYVVDLKGLENYKGYFIFRLVPAGEKWREPAPPPGKLLWMCWFTKKEAPYVLMRDARVKKDYVPDGKETTESGLSPDWEAKIKPEFRWWVGKKSRKEKLLLMDLAFNDLCERKVLPHKPLPIKESIAGYLEEKGFTDGETNLALDTLEKNLAEQTDTAVVLMTFGELQAKGMATEDIIEEIVKGLLPIGFDAKYWRAKVKEILTQHGILRK